MNFYEGAMKTLQLQERSQYKLMVPKVKRTCLSATSALSGKPNIEDVPLGAKLPMVPGSHILLYTAELGNKLHQTSCDFDLRFPKEEFMNNEYRFLHDRHLRRFYMKRNDVVDKIKQLGLITEENKVNCTLKEYNAYRQYLKQLSLEMLTRLYRENYSKERAKTKAALRASIQQKQQDRFNPINVRINRAREVRDSMDKVRLRKRKKLLQSAEKEKEARLREQKDTMERRIKMEIEREREREKIKKLKMMQRRKEEFLREEVLYFKHQEDVFRSKELEEKRKVLLLEKEKKLVEKYERKRKFHLAKMAELRQIAEDEEARRMEKVQIWKDYFGRKLQKQQQNLKEVLERNRKERAAFNKKIAKSLRRRGWHGSNFWLPGGRRRNTELFTHRQLSDLGFHAAVADDDIYLSDEDLSGGDAMSGDTEEKELNEKYTLKAQMISVDALEISRSVLVPILHGYERRTKTHVLDAEVQPLLHELCPSIFRENLRSEQNSLASGAISSESIFNKKLLLLQEEKRKLAFEEIIDEERELEATESRTMLEETIRNLASKVAGQVLAHAASSDELSDLREKIGSRIAMLASSVVNDILALGAKAAAQALPPSGTSSPSSSGDSEDGSFVSTESSVEQKLSWIAKTMVEEMLVQHVSEMNNQESSSGSGMSDLAHHVAKSALDKVLNDNERRHPASNVMESIAPKIKELSSRILSEIIEAKERFKADKTPRKAGTEDFVKLENKISKLALSVVESLMQSNALSHSASHVTDSTISSEAKAPGPTVDEFLNAIFHLKSHDDLPRGNMRPLADAEVETISHTIAKKVAPSCDDSPGMLTGIHHLVAALADDVTARTRKEPQRATSIALAIKHLADEVVNKTLEDQRAVTKVGPEGQQSEVKPPDQSSVESAVSDLAGAVITSTMQKLKHESGRLDAAGPKPGLEKSSDVMLLHDNAVDAASKLFSAVLNKLVAEFAKIQSSEEKSSEASSNIESVLSSAVSQIVVDVISSKVLERIQEHVGNLSTTDSTHLIKEIKEIVFGLFKSDSEKISNKTDKSKSSSNSRQTSLLSSTDRSTISSAAGALAGSILQQLLGIQDVKLETVPEYGDTPSLQATDFSEIDEKTSTSLSSAIGMLHSDLSQFSLEENKMYDMENALNKAASRVVTEAISNKIFERIQEQTVAKLSEIETSQLKREVRVIVMSLLDSHESTSSSEGIHKTKGAIPWSSSDQSTMSSATSAIASNLMHQILGNLSISDTGSFLATDQSSLSSGASELAGQVTKHVLEKLSRKTGITGGENSKRISSKQKRHKTSKRRSSSHPRQRRCKSEGAMATIQEAAHLRENSFSSKREYKRKKGRKGQYRYSFVSWKDQLLHPESERRKKFRKKKTGSVLESPLEDFKESADERALDELALRIVRSVVEKQTKKLNLSDQVTDLKKPTSSHSLMENLALGVVSSLLGLDIGEKTSQSETLLNSSSNDITLSDRSVSSRVPSPSAGLLLPSSRSSLSSSDDASSISLDLFSSASSSSISTLKSLCDVEVPLATYNLVSALVRPPTAIPRRRAVKCQEEDKYQQLAKILNAPSSDSMKQYTSSCEDNAMDHPHRVLSPTLARSQKRKGLGKPTMKRLCHETQQNNLDKTAATTRTKKCHPPLTSKPLKYGAQARQRMIQEKAKR